MCSQGWMSHAIATVVLGAAIVLSIKVNLWLAALLAAAIFFPIRPFVSGIVYFLGPGNLHLEFGERGLGFGARRAEWWIPIEEIASVKENQWGTSTIRHYAGTCIDYPTGGLEKEDAELLKDAVASYRSSKP
jgi:hypothetical protein